MLKQKLCCAPILALPDGKQRFHRILRRFEKGFGAVLMQRENCSASNLEDVLPCYGDLRTVIMHDGPKICIQFLGGHFRMLWVLNLDMVPLVTSTKQTGKAREAIQTLKDMLRVLCMQSIGKEGRFADLKRKPMGMRQVEDKVIERVGEVAYKLELPEELSRVQNTFHWPLSKRLKRCRIPLVKVRWNSKRGPEFTWEREDQFKKKYPHLFTETTSSSSAAL
ncbi:hypothetical protein Tco_0587091 [Tanacetum coccineum]